MRTQALTNLTRVHPPRVRPPPKHLSESLTPKRHLLRRLPLRRKGRAWAVRFRRRRGLPRGVRRRPPRGARAHGDARRRQLRGRLGGRPLRGAGARARRARGSGASREARVGRAAHRPASGAALFWQAALFLADFCLDQQRPQDLHCAAALLTRTRGATGAPRPPSPRLARRARRARTATQTAASTRAPGRRASSTGRARTGTRPAAASRARGSAAACAARGGTTSRATTLRGGLSRASRQVGGSCRAWVVGQVGRGAVSWTWTTRAVGSPVGGQRLAAARHARPTM
jgi:hypothetical protein